MSILLGIAIVVSGCGGLDKGHDTVPPETPRNFRLVGAGDGQAFFRWDPNTEPDLREYAVQRADSAGGSFETIVRIVETEFTDQFLEYERTYYYRIQAGDQSGNYSGFTDPIDVTPLNLSSPLRPRGLVVQGYNLALIPLVGFALRWEPNSESDLDHYRVYRGNEPDFVIADSTLIDSIGTNALFDPLELIAERYYYSVVAVDRGGKTSFPSVPADDILLGSPRIISPKGDAQVTLPFDFQWERLANAEGYRIYVGPSAFSPAFWSSGLLQGDATRLRYSGPPLAPNTVQYWWMAAHSRRTDTLPDGTEVESDINSLSDYGRFIVR